MKSQQLDSVVRRATRIGNRAFTAAGKDRQTANRRAAVRRQREGKYAAGRQQIETRKALRGRMDADELDAVLETAAEQFGVKLRLRGPAVLCAPRLTSRELLMLAASIDDGTTYRDRCNAIDRLAKLGFSVSFVEPQRPRR